MTAFETGDEVYWWKQVTRSIKYPYRAQVLSVGDKKIKINVHDVSDEELQVVRHVAAESLQIRETFYSKAPKQRPAILEPASLWGQRTIYLEVGEDLYIEREVEVFDNGNMLSYDRVHWVDAFGSIGGAQINRNQRSGPWGSCEEIDATEFERVWKSARESIMWPQQQATAQMDERGLVPIWLTVKKWRPAPLSTSR
jgi:hypothetical protein